MKKSKTAPSFAMVSKSDFGLKQMQDKDPAMPMRPNTVTMETTPIKPLTGIAKMEPAHAARKPWKPMGRK